MNTAIRNLATTLRELSSQKGNKAQVIKITAELKKKVQEERKRCLKNSSL
jgi:bacterioferritin-associated ferredoxin